MCGCVGTCVYVWVGVCVHTVGDDIVEVQSEHSKNTAFVCF